MRSDHTSLPEHCHYLLHIFRVILYYRSCSLQVSTMIWTVTLAAVLLLPSCEVLESKEAIPFTRQFGILGKEIVVHCHTSVPYVEWRFNGREIENSDDVNLNGSHHLTLVEAKKHESGNYSCHRPHSNKTLFLTELQLGLPPEELQIHCWSASYPEKIKCTWHLHPDTNIHTTFLTTYRLGLLGPGSPKKCIQHEMNPRSCVIRNFQMFEAFPYLLNVTALNQLGSITQLHYFFAENIIRPDPPVNVSISPICHESKKLYMQWRPPYSWPYPDLFPLKYNVRYRKEGSKFYTVVGPYEHTSIVLTGIRPGTFVHVQVAAKDITDMGHNSDWSEVVTGRPWKPHDFMCFSI
ncbi:interleukin-27 subunit beta isoform 2-T2 [Anomaloglossus baeobatrachus]|uniref:interleukin-27 subunit beta n=1 Tax=Anomaloglossus baeobatrachus TaxID=238106 RepID=UPI003F50CF92